ncbi:MAG TPA: hypothetical protein VEL80_02980 [Burkholderiales bacterium]|nr:hypothetical protein [Burkholderiales bacterium]
MTRPIRYTIVPARPEAHFFRVTCTVEDPDPSGQRFTCVLSEAPGARRRLLDRWLERRGG